MNDVIGFLPEEIIYVYDDNNSQIVNISELTTGSEETDDSEEENLNEVNNVTVKPIFPCDKGNKKLNESGKRWATRHNSNVKEFEFKNTGIKNLRIVGLEVRGNGGRAYKVVDENGFYFDLREDALMEGMINAGIEKGGYLKGEYVWGKIGSQTKIIRKDSVLYNNLVENNTIKDLKIIPKKDFKIGGIYYGKNKARYLYLGLVDYLSIVYSSTTTLNDIERIDKKEKELLFFRYRDNLSDLTDKKNYNYYSFEIKKSHNFNVEEKIIQIPDNCIEILRNKALFEYRNYKRDHVVDSLFNRITIKLHSDSSFNIPNDFAILNTHLRKHKISQVLDE